jgi:methylated-DNA-protein-cysteine methyltransferase-like protein
MNFSQKVYEIVKNIPHGKVASYGQIAKMLDNPRGARKVGWAMSNCPEGLPWWRVVMTDGSVTGGSHAELRLTILMEEKIPFLPNGKVDMKKCMW